VRTDVRNTKDFECLLIFDHIFVFFLHSLYCVNGTAERCVILLFKAKIVLTFGIWLKNCLFNKFCILTHRREVRVDY
jgi:hypothetical protein